KRGKLLALTEGQRLVAFIRVEAQLDPLAAALAGAARQVGRLLVTGTDRDPANRGQAEGMVAGGARLAESIRPLQQDGQGVIPIAAGKEVALAGADCGFGVLTEEHRPPWGAHLMGGPGLETAWLLLEAATVARVVSRRGARLATYGTVAGALLGMADATP